MATMKDYVKVIITALITALITLTVTGVFNQNGKINNAATKQELIVFRNAANTYTDNKLVEHEKVHDEIHTQYLQIQTDLTIIKDHLINR